MHGLDEGFHWRDGWYFKREEGGTVRVTHADPGHELLQFRIDAKEWASIIAAVSRNGESSESYRHALDFHGDKHS